MKKSKMLASIFLAIAVALSYGQDFQSNKSYSISGVVVDASTGEILPFCNVYFSKTLKGTTSDVNGHFKIEDVKPGSYVLVASFVGYKTLNANVEVINKDYEKLRIELRPDVQTLESVSVETEKDKEWEKSVKEFERYVLGNVQFAKKCEIKNPWVISFSGSKTVRKAEASEPVEIHNRALGFKIFMNLNDYVKTPKTFTYNGYFRFELLDPTDKKEQKKWIRNQESAYKGSLAHFLKSLTTKNWEDEGFILFLTDANETRIDASNHLNYFKLSQKDKHWKLTMTQSMDLFFQGIGEGEQTTLLSPIKGREILFNEDGILKDPLSLSLNGHLPTEGLSTLLPFDYYQDLRIDYEAKERKAKKEFIAKLENYRNSKPYDVFVRTDKESYFSGETIWISTSLLNSVNHSPIYQPANLKIQFFDSVGNRLIENKINSVNGVGKGNVVLPPSLATGKYLIRAFAEGNEQQVFERPILVQDFSIEVDSSKSKKEEVFLKFYPEGGQLISNKNCRVAFKSNLRDFEGALYNQKGKELSSISSIHEGLGWVDFIPDPDENYYIKIDGQNEQFNLPEQSDGAALRVSSEEDKVSIKVNFSESTEGIYYLLAHQRGTPVFLDHLGTDREDPFEISKEIIEPGILAITLFDQDKRPISERLIYIPGNDESDLKVTLNKQEFLKREKVTVNLESSISESDTLFTDLSIAVLDLNQANSSVDIVTYIHALSATDMTYPEKNGDLLKAHLNRHSDLYMLIHGWRKFDWENIFNKELKGRSLQSGIAISGDLKRKNGKPLAQSTLSLFVSQNGNMFNTTTDSEGRFSFQNLNVTDTSNLILKIDPQKGILNPPVLSLDRPSSSDSLAWNKRFQTPEWVTPDSVIVDQDVLKLLAYKRKLDQENENYVLLNEVVVTTEKERTIDPRKAVLGKGDHSIYTEDLPFSNYQTIYDLIQGRVPGVRIYNVGNGIDPNSKIVIIRSAIVPFRPLADQAATILVDNVPIPALEAASIINPQDVESVEVFTSASAAGFGARGATGVVAFYTKRGSTGGRPVATDPLVKTFIYDNAFYSYKEFKSPDYSRPVLSTQYLDSRATLYWIPNISITNYKGAEFSFYTSDQDTRLLIDIQGVTQQGELIHRTEEIEVKGD